MIHPSQIDRAAITVNETRLLPVATAAADLVNLANRIGMTSIRRFSPELAARIEGLETAVGEVVK